jgi:hypothetical protein
MALAVTTPHTRFRRVWRAFDQSRYAVLIGGVLYLGILYSGQLKHSWNIPGALSVVATLAIPAGILWLMRRGRNHEATQPFERFFEAAAGIAMVLLIVLEFWRTR